ncbi:DUF3426 domain-containing protein [Pseudomonas sp. MWU13-3659]|uniref:DUF3426 domain-containing protein n=1 Tax=Pseudomonas sp. MWU13-3659 TaxID=2986964 RepID=UPI002075AFC8|nr:DUF3426 domain-containing protein [Pseudomonas sp. MWU13-3659]
MTDSFVTQCPHCQTSFRVTHHQLSVARGVVRCGNCLQVFNAAKQLLEQNRAASDRGAAVPAEPAPAAPPLPVAPPVAEPPAADEDDWAVTAEELDALDLDSELARLERRSPAERQAAITAGTLHARRDDQGSEEPTDELFGTATDDDLAPPPERETAPVLLEQAPLEPDLDVDERTEPTLGTTDLDLDDELPVRHQALDDDLDTPSTPLATHDEPLPEKGLSALDDEVRGERLSAHDEDVLDDHPVERLEPSLLGKPERPNKEPLVDVVDDPLQLAWEKPAPNWGKRLLWGFLTLLAAGLLAFQYVWFHFDEMARQDQYRPWFQQLCPMVGCQVPTRVDISRIKSSNLVVRSHPDFKGALIVDAIIYNRAPFAQPFPLLELRFADLNGQLIASRRFKPSEYLSGELAGRGEMPSQTPIHIALDILDPGPKAVNYSLSFRSPE